MSIEVLFWVLMLLWLVFGLWREYEAGKPYPYIRGVGNLLVFVLLALLGWKVFGPAIHG